MFGKNPDPSKTEDATPKRIKKQREEGNVPKSQELGKAVSLTCGMAVLALWIPAMNEIIQTLFRKFLAHAWEFDPNIQNVNNMFMDVVGDLAKLLLPIMLFLAFAAIIAQRVQVGKLWTTKVFKPKWSKFNIIKGLKQMFCSSQTILRTLKSLVFAIVLCIIPAWLIWSEHENFLPMFDATAEGVASYMLDMAFKLACYALFPILAIAGFDIWQSRFAYKENMKMSKQEVKDERKNMDGDPIIKSKQKQKMFEVMQKRMLQAVPKADVVVTNPDHIAVALLYNSQESPAPVVVAKGVDHMAEKIKEIARENNVPVRENVPLARALYKAVEIGDMIPEELYKAVATLLASIWKLKPRAAR